MRRIAQANGLRNWHKLRLGQLLEIPVTASAVATRQPTVPTSRNVKKIYYTVRPGDTLSEIAEVHNMGLSKLRSWNGIHRNSSGSIKVGQKLVLWLPTKPPPVAAQPVVPAGMVKQTYIVRSGDTLSQIAEAHSVGLSTLRQWNGFRPGTGHIRVGQKLVIYRTAG